LKPLPSTSSTPSNKKIRQTVKQFDKSFQKKDQSLKKNDEMNERLELDKCKVIEEKNILGCDIEKEKANASLVEVIAYVESLIQDEKNTDIHTYDSETKRFSRDTQLCVMNLLSEGVGVKHVNKVSEHVAQFCGKTVTKLPSERTINGIGDQRAGISYFLISEEVGTKMYTTMQSDETRKSGSCCEFFSVRDSDEKEWVIGLKDMIDKRSSNSLKTLKVIT